MEISKLEIARAKANAKDMMSRVKKELEDALAARSAAPGVVFERGGKIRLTKSKKSC